MGHNISLSYLEKRIDGTDYSLDVDGIFYEENDTLVLDSSFLTYYNENTHTHVEITDHKFENRIIENEFTSIIIDKLYEKGYNVIKVCI